MLIARLISIIEQAIEGFQAPNLESKLQRGPILLLRKLPGAAETPCGPERRMVQQRMVYAGDNLREKSELICVGIW